MRVLYLIHDTSISGAALSLFNLLEGMAGKNVEIHVAGPQPSDSYRSRLVNIGVEYHVVNPVMSIMPPLKRLKNFASFLKNYFKLLINKKRYFIELEYLIKELSPDLIHTNVGVLHEGFKVASKYRIPHIFHLREYQDKDFNWRFYPSKKKFVRMLRSTNVICISEDIKNHFGLDCCQSCRTIYNGILHKNEASFCTKKENYFMTASRISPEKDIAMTICAFSIFVQSHNNYCLRIFGDGAEIYKKELKNLVLELGVENYVVFEGYASNIPDYLERASALIVSSKNEGFGRMSAEALMKGCILIGRNSGGTKEIMDAIPSFPFDDINECAKQMSKVVDYLREGYDSQIRESQKIAVNLYSIEQNVEKIYGFYGDILNRFKS